MIFRADCILAGDDFEEISPGAVRVEDGRIVELGSDVSCSGSSIVDYRQGVGPDQRTVIVPGLIDCHCHLELSNLAGKLDYHGSLVRWLGELVARRPKRWSSQEKAVRRGAAASLANGTTTVADISANGRSWQALMDLPIRKVCFAEIVGTGRKTGRALAKLRKKIDAMPDDDSTFFKGVSPHAPYSTGLEVYREAISLAAERRLRLTTHLAEDPAEIEFLKTGGGPWRKVLKALGLWDQSVKPFGGSPVEWAKEVGLLDIPAILAHVNYVDDRDIELLAKGKASVAYCPAAHCYFNHTDHRYRDMIAAGVNVVLGNDSLACNPQLSILAQMQAVFQAGGLPARSVFAMGTTAAAKALGLEKTIGSLAIGKQGDLAVFIIRKGPGSVLETALQPSVQVALTMFEGSPNDRSR